MSDVVMSKDKQGAYKDCRTHRTLWRTTSGKAHRALVKNKDKPLMGFVPLPLKATPSNQIEFYEGDHLDPTYWYGNIKPRPFRLSNSGKHLTLYNVDPTPMPDINDVGEILKAHLITKFHHASPIPLAKSTDEANV